MATKFGVEAVVESINATLQANIATELTTVWAGWADNATVPQPVFDNSNIKPYLLHFPAVPPAMYTEAVGARVTMDNAPNYQYTEYTVRITVGLQLDNVSVIAFQTMRTMEAVRRVIEHNTQADGTVAGWLGMTPLRCQYSEIMKSPMSGYFIHWGAWEVIARIEASY